MAIVDQIEVLPAPDVLAHNGAAPSGTAPVASWSLGTDHAFGSSDYTAATRGGAAVAPALRHLVVMAAAGDLRALPVGMNPQGESI